jgi:hypothetical protein
MKYKKAQSNIAFLYVVIIFTMFFFAISSVISITGWNKVTESINNIDNETIQQDVKDKINNLDFITSWADKLFVISFIVMLLIYIGTASLATTDNPIIVFLLLGLNVLVTIISMVLSNAWTWIIGNTNFSNAAQYLDVTGFFMRYFPIITFFVGFLGIIIFYARKKISFQTTSGGFNDFE